MWTRIHMSENKKMSFLERLEALAISEVSFTSFVKDVSVNDDGSKFVYYRLQLENPIPKVVAHGTIFNPELGKRVRPHVSDVREVCVSHTDIVESQDGWTFEEVDGNLTGKGSYKGDLILDVSLNSGQVWLGSQKLTSKSKEWREKFKNEKLNRLFGFES